MGLNGKELMALRIVSSFLDTWASPTGIAWNSLLCNVLLVVFWTPAPLQRQGLLGIARCLQRIERVVLWTPRLGRRAPQKMPPRSSPVQASPGLQEASGMLQDTEKLPPIGAASSMLMPPIGAVSSMDPAIVETAEDKIWGLFLSLPMLGILGPIVVGSLDNLGGVLGPEVVRSWENLRGILGLA